MTTVRGIVYDTSGNPVSGRTVRAYRRDTGVLLGSATSHDGSPPTGNPYFNNAELLLPLDTVFTDVSPTPKTATVNGSASISSGWSKYGGASASFANSTSDYVTYGAASAFDWLTLTLEDWTIHGWFRVPNVTGAKTIVAKGTNNTTQACVLVLVSGANIQCSIYQSTAYVGVAAVASGVAANTDHHFEVIYNAATRKFKVALDGVFGAEATLAASTEYVTANGGQLTLGRFSDAAVPMNGYVDDLEILRGVKAHTSDFTPPSAALGTWQLTPTLALGEYYIDLAGYAGEINVVALDDAGGSTENDLIIRTTGV